MSNQLALEKMKMESEAMKMQMEMQKQIAMSNLYGAKTATLYPSNHGATARDDLRIEGPGVEYSLRIRPAANGGYAVYFESDVFIANNAEELSKVVIVAIARAKIKA